ncbi:unnamed protein product [Brassica napus]|uniref:(rape) hypothetical protein n=1 Tax=Brassica napus TaxID=3708 RepID=A0A816JS20_BRANA|nr:unnamed protein product [Brassica napus]
MMMAEIRPQQIILTIGNTHMLHTRFSPIIFCCYLYNINNHML